MNEIGELLIQLRKKKGVNQDELASYLGISRPTISDYERGKTMPDLPTMLALARYYGVSLDNVFSNLIFEKGMWKKSTKGNQYGNLKGNLSAVNEPVVDYGNSKNSEALIATLKELVESKNEIIAELKGKNTDLKNALKECEKRDAKHKEAGHA